MLDNRACLIIKLDRNILRAFSANHIGTVFIDNRITGQFAWLFGVFVFKLKRGTVSSFDLGGIAVLIEFIGAIVLKVFRLSHFVGNALFRAELVGTHLGMTSFSCFGNERLNFFLTFFGFCP
ncbi:MAG: hypothetical protein BWY75_01855 [bacterium ADurb.Bin425]|nr:MAG: hypothetical protein BWY75_01855 [bacterium ADurb.Bin425]